MNKLDAIEILKSMLPEKISYAELVGAVGCYGGGEYVYSDPEPYAIETAISALEKQMPKKIKSCSCCRNVCPSCGGAVHKVLRTEKYCQYCGQLIDWGDRDD